MPLRRRAHCMLSPRPFQAAVGLFAALAVALAPATPARGDASSSPAGASAVGSYLDLGAAHGCALQKDRMVRCWGKGASGRLGGGQTDDRLSSAGAGDATAVSIGQVTALTAGELHTCVLLSGGSVRCWGEGSSGQLGSGGRDSRRDGHADHLSGTDEASTVPLGGAATAISAGGEFTCALMSDGAVRCWGDGRAGVLGSRATDSRLDGLPDGPTDEASVVALGGAATAITAGTQHACALLAGGAVRCWGAGANGRLGSGATDDRLDGEVAGGTDEASSVPLAEPATAISAGESHTCALLASGAVSCWGLGASGQLGAGRSDSRLDGVVSGSGAGATDAATTVPLKLPGTAQNRLTTAASVRATAIAAGAQHTCAIVEGGDVRCWGQGSLGQLGHSATDNRLEASVSNLSDIATRVGFGTNGQTGAGLGAPAVGLTAGAGATCAELAAGTVRCWGDGSDGRLGTRATDPRLDGAVDLATGTDSASTVPVGPVPSVFGDLLTEPAPAGLTPAPVTSGPPSGAAPAPAAAPQLAFTFTVKGRKANLTALLVPKKAGKCPKTARVTVTEGKTNLGAADLKVKKTGTHCRARGSVALKRSPKKNKPLTATLKAKGLASRTLVRPR